MAFENALFDYDDHKMKDNDTLVAHFIHSILWIAYVKGKIDPYKNMTPENFYARYRSFFDKVVAKYKKERNYDVYAHAILIGIKWFIDSKTVDE